jgi:hypothetical protein
VHDKEWSVCRVPPQAHGKSPVAAGILGQFAVCLPYDARQIDPIVLFFSVFHVQKFLKNIDMIYISIIGIIYHMHHI